MDAEKRRNIIMTHFPEGFLIGAASAAHQVEGNNTNSDIWALEHMKTGGYPEKSGLAADFYHTYDEDFARLEKAGLNACRFSIEWARIEPQEGVFDEKETEHYRDVIRSCRRHGMEPVVTLFHFSSPKWLISRGGWEADSTPEYFERYVRYIAEQYKDELKIVCTINEANLGALIAGYIRKMMENSDTGVSLQMGMDLEGMKNTGQTEAEKENLEVFGVPQTAVFPSPRSPHGTEVILEAHRRAVKALHEIIPGVKAGLSLSLNDLQVIPGGEEEAQKQWESIAAPFLKSVQGDDYLGVQNYTRSVYGSGGELPPAEGAELTEMNYEYYPQALANVLRRVRQEFNGDLLVTENGIATLNDKRRCDFIREALQGVRECVEEGVPVRGYIYWTMIDNYEWQSGYSQHFGLMALDRETQTHTPRESLNVLGSYLR